MTYCFEHTTYEHNLKLPNSPPIMTMINCTTCCELHQVSAEQLNQIMCFLRSRVIQKAFLSLTHCSESISIDAFHLCCFKT